MMISTTKQNRFIVFLLLLLPLFIEAKRSFTFPLRSKRIDVPNGRRRLQRNVTLPLHGAVKDFGYFYASIYLGTPARKFAVIVDTGSTMTYVPCSTCGSGCGPNHQDAAFDPIRSTTASLIGCSSSKCHCGSPQCGCNSEDRCIYTRSYAEQSSSSGLLVEDHMALNDGGDGAPIIFGCETHETGEIFKQRADGLFGLGNSDASVVNQLVTAGVIEDVFSLCFGSVEGHGALTLGSTPVANNLNLQYTPLIKSPRHPYYYTVKLMGMTLGGENLQIASSVFDQGYGTVLDSGTTFTYVPTPVFKAFTAAITAQAQAAGLQKVPGPDPQYDDICFGDAPEYTELEALSRLFPSLQLTFDGGVTLSLSPLNYLFVHTFGSGKYCLGVFDNGGSGTLLGGITFRNVLVEYDRRNQRVGFSTAQCKEFGEGYRPPCSSLGDLAGEAEEDGDCQPDGNGGSTTTHSGGDDSNSTGNDDGEQDQKQQEEQQQGSDGNADVQPSSSTTSDDSDSNEDQTTTSGDSTNKDAEDVGSSEQEEQQDEEQQQSSSTADDLDSDGHEDNDDWNSEATTAAREADTAAFEAEIAAQQEAETIDKTQPAAFMLLGGVVAVMAAAFAAALLRPSSRESIRNLMPGSKNRYRPLNDDRDPENGRLLHVINGSAVNGNNSTTSSSGNGNNNQNNNSGGAPKGLTPVTIIKPSNGSGSGRNSPMKPSALSVTQLMPIKSSINNNNNGAKLGGGDGGGSITMNTNGGRESPTKQPSNGNSMAVIAMTDLSSKSGPSGVLIGGEKRAGLTTPQKLQRTVSNTSSNASAMLAELGGDGSNLCSTPPRGSMVNGVMLPGTPPRPRPI